MTDPKLRWSERIVVNPDELHALANHILTYGKSMGFSEAKTAFMIIDIGRTALAHLGVEHYEITDLEDPNGAGFDA